MKIQPNLTRENILLKINKLLIKPSTYWKLKFFIKVDYHQYDDILILFNNKELLNLYQQLNNENPS